MSRTRQAAAPRTPAPAVPVPVLADDAWEDSDLRTTPTLSSEYFDEVLRGLSTRELRSPEVFRHFFGSVA